MYDIICLADRPDMKQQMAAMKNKRAAMAMVESEDAIC